MLKSIVRLAALIFMFQPVVYAYADIPDHPMTFRLSGTGGNCSTCEWIAAEGLITEDTPKVFKNFVVSELYSPGGTVAFNSPGGNLAAALELGLFLRSLGFETTVADTVIAATDESVGIDGRRRRTE